MPLGLPDPNQGQQPPVGGNSIPMLLKMLSGAALKNVSKSTLDFSQVGADIKGVLDDPFVMAGAGLEALGVPPDMLMSFLKPPEPPPEQKAPQIPIQALLPALTARMGPRGLSATTMQPPMPGGPPLPPMRMGGLPSGLPPPPPTMMGGM